MQEEGVILNRTINAVSAIQNMQQEVLIFRTVKQWINDQLLAKERRGLPREIAHSEVKRARSITKEQTVERTIVTS